MTEKIKTKKVKKVKIKNKNKLVSNIIVNVNSHNKKKVSQNKKEGQQKSVQPFVITNNPPQYAPQYNPYMQPQIQQPQLIQNDIGLGVHRSLEGLQTRIQVLFDEQEHQRNAHQRDLQHRDDAIRFLINQQQEQAKDVFIPSSQQSRLTSSPTGDFNKPRRVNFSANTDFSETATIKPKPRNKKIIADESSGSEGDIKQRQTGQSILSFKPSKTDKPQSTNLFDYDGFTQSEGSKRFFKNQAEMDAVNLRSQKTLVQKSTDKALVQSTSPPPSTFHEFFADPAPNSYLVIPQQQTSNNLEDYENNNESLPMKSSDLNTSFISNATEPSDISSIDNDSLPPPPPPRHLRTTELIDPPSVVRYRQTLLESLYRIPEFREHYSQKHELVEKQVIGGKKGEMEMVLVSKKNGTKVSNQTLERAYKKYFKE